MQVKTIFSQIERKSGFAIVYEHGVIDLNTRVNISATDESVDEVLDKVLAQTGNSYVFVNNQIVITRKAIEIFEQKQEVEKLKGTVIDERNEAVIGASVMVKNTNAGTVTDLDGKFEINMPERNSVLTITYLGYKPYTVTITTQKVLNVKLIPEDSGLDEIVVIGYGTVKKRDLTGSVASVKSKDIVGIPTSNAMEAIQGKAAGIDIVRVSGEAGSAPEITVRGNRSINGKNSPLFIIDGIQGGSYEDLNTNDIASIDILKDASSTAIYGAQGANGVVIITTKKGESGKAKVTYDGYLGVNTNVQYPKPLRGDAFMNYRREAFRTIDAWSGPADDVNAFTSDELQAISDNKWVNWIDLVTRTGTQQSHTVSVQSGTENTKVFLSLGYYQEQGIFPGDEAKRYTGRINVDQTINKVLKVGLYSQLTYWNKDQINKLLLARAAIAFPLATPYDENGDIALFPMVGRANAYSPLADYVKDKSKKHSKQLNTTLNGYVELTPIKGLTFRSNFGANLNFTRNGSFYAQHSLAQTTNPSTASIENKNKYFLTWDNVLTYKKVFGDIHSLGLTALSSWTKYEEEDSKASNSGQSVDSFLFYNLGSGVSTMNQVSSGYKSAESMSYAGRVEYALMGRYLLSASIRLDGASQLAKGNKWHSFPSVSGAWILSEENFLKNVRWVNNLKLRASWGISGNAAVDPYSTMMGLIVSNSWGFGNNAASTYKYSPTIANANLTWEKSKTYDIGVDFSVLGGRINISADYYHTKTSDILMKRDMPTSVFGTDAVMWQNIAATKNKGIELTLNTVNLKTKDFEWSSTLTFSKDNEEITSLVDGRNIIAKEDTKHSLLIGKPIKSWWDLKKTGIWQSHEADEAAKYSYYGSVPKPGDIKIHDETGDYKIEDDDEVYVGSNTPDWVGGFLNSFYFKGFDLSVYMFARWGQTIAAKYMYGYNPAGAVSSGNGMQQANIFDTFDYWTPENPTNDFPRPAAETILPTTGRSLYFVDGSFFKVKTVTLGYTFPKEWTKKAFVENLRIYATANNLFTKAKSHLLMNYDPEGNGGDEMPLFKTFVFGLSITF